MREDGHAHLPALSPISCATLLGEIVSRNLFPVTGVRLLCSTVIVFSLTPPLALVRLRVTTYE